VAAAIDDIKGYNGGGWSMAGEVVDTVVDGSCGGGTLR
jgi:hypothetical protein